MIAILTGLARKGARGPVGPLRPVVGIMVKTHGVRLSDEKVLAIRVARLETGATIYELAERFGVQPQQVSRILRFEGWKHVGMPAGLVPLSGTHRKLTAEDVKAVNELRAQGMKQHQIATRLSISRPAVSMLLTGKTHV